MLIQTLLKKKNWPTHGNVARPAPPTEALDQQVCLQQLWGGGCQNEALTLFFKYCLRGNFSLETSETKECGAVPHLSFISVPFLYISSCPSVCIALFVPPFLFAFKIMKLCCGPCLPFTSSCSSWWYMGEFRDFF